MGFRLCLRNRFCGDWSSSGVSSAWNGAADMAISIPLFLQGPMMLQNFEYFEFGVDGVVVFAGRICGQPRCCKCVRCEHDNSGAKYVADNYILCTVLMIVAFHRPATRYASSPPWPLKCSARHSFCEYLN